MNAVEDKWPDDHIQRRKLEKILPRFKKDGERLVFNGKLCISRKSVSDVLQLAHDSNISGHFKFARHCRDLAISIGGTRVEIFESMWKDV